MDKKPALAVMIGLGKPKGSESKDSGSSESMSDDDDELDAVVDELADAIVSGDKDAMKEALKAFKECC